MIHEIAELSINADDAVAFEAAVAQAAPLFKAAKGCRSFALQRCIETPGRYHLVVGWETLENHTVDFRESDNFQQWRALAGPYFVSPPNVVHMDTVLEAF